MRWLLWILATEFVAAGLWGLLVEFRPGHRRRRRSAADRWRSLLMVGLGLMLGSLTTWSETAGRLSQIPFYGALLLMVRYDAKHAESEWARRAANLAGNPQRLVRHPVWYLHEIVEVFGHPARATSQTDDPGPKPDRQGRP